MPTAGSSDLALWFAEQDAAPSYGGYGRPLYPLYPSSRAIDGHDVHLGHIESSKLEFNKARLLRRAVLG
jgi:hypothetical protein